MGRGKSGLSLTGGRYPRSEPSGLDSTGVTHLDLSGYPIYLVQVDTYDAEPWMYELHCEAGTMPVAEKTNPWLTFAGAEEIWGSQNASGEIVKFLMYGESSDAVEADVREYADRYALPKIESIRADLASPAEILLSPPRSNR